MCVGLFFGGRLVHKDKTLTCLVKDFAVETVLLLSETLWVPERVRMGLKSLFQLVGYGTQSMYHLLFQMLSPYMGRGELDQILCRMYKNSALRLGKGGKIM